MGLLNVLTKLDEILLMESFPQEKIDNLIKELSICNQNEKLDKIRLCLENADNDNWKLLINNSIRLIALRCNCVGEKGVCGEEGIN